MGPCLSKSAAEKKAIRASLAYAAKDNSAQAVANDPNAKWWHNPSLAAANKAGESGRMTHDDALAKLKKDGALYAAHNGVDVNDPSKWNECAWAKVVEGLVEKKKSAARSKNSSKAKTPTLEDMMRKTPSSPGSPGSRDGSGSGQGTPNSQRARSKEAQVGQSAVGRTMSREQVGVERMMSKNSKNSGEKRRSQWEQNKTAQAAQQVHPLLGMSQADLAQRRGSSRL